MQQRRSGFGVTFCFFLDCPRRFFKSPRNEAPMSTVMPRFIGCRSARLSPNPNYLPIVTGGVSGVSDAGRAASGADGEVA